MRFATEEKTCDVSSKNLYKKSETRKEITVAFQTEPKKREAEETSSKMSEDRKRAPNASQPAIEKTERPKSAGCLPRKGLECGIRKRPKSTETGAFRGVIKKNGSELEMKKKLEQAFQIRDMPRRIASRCESGKLLDPESRRSILCDCRARSYLCDYEMDAWTGSSFYKVGMQRRRCKSNPNFSKTNSAKEKDLYKIRRSLQLIGLELSDFGVYSSGGVATTAEFKLKRNSSTFSTKLTARSLSLESLRHAIRRAWLEDRLDHSHRKLLSQAAYEEWYFKKEKELQQKQEEERYRKTIAKENMRKDFERKKAKAEEEFRKWIQRKRIKRKENENLEKQSEHDYDRIRKTKRDTEAAFLKWKKEKDEELEKRKRQKKKEKEKKMELERQKIEKKIIAEKAFHQWKIKLEETQKSEEVKRMKLKSKQEELEKKQKLEERNRISFQVWKKAKDEEIRQQMKQIRKITTLEREERQTRMEERMYEAEQAFEDWLEKIDLRQRKQFNDDFQKIPWIPA